MKGSLVHPHLKPYLPLLYVAWADGELETVEQDALREQLQRHAWLTPQQRDLLLTWLDPRKPPSPVDLAELRLQLRSIARTMKPEKRRSLSELGAAMAALTSGSEATAQALRDLEDVLGLAGHEAAEQLYVTPDPDEGPPSAVAQKSSLVPPASFASQPLQQLLDSPPGAAAIEANVRNEVRQFLSDPSKRAFDQPRAKYREQVLGWLRELAEAGISGYAYPGVTSDVDSMAAFLVAFETLGYGDLSLLVKFGVQFGLFGGSIYFLGTEAQRREYLPDVASLALPGCYAMSEVGHGSNVMQLQTTAVFDASSNELVIHTPHEAARKEWIGNAALHGRMATVFAQLEVAGLQHGVHAILVPIRDEKGAPLPGVRIGDNGPKMGLEGVDNGRLWFERVRVPKENLLGRFAHINESGEYESPIASPNKRFFTMLGTLVAGRLSVAAGSLSAAKVGMAIADRYGESRRQFGPEKGQEVPLMAYQTHQRRLLPRLAGLYAMHFGLATARRRYLALQSETADAESGVVDTRRIEALAAGLKAYVTAHATDTLRECREACGGQGYLRINRIGDLMNDTEVYKTFEGDNTVLLQLVAKGLLTEYRSQFTESRLMGVLQQLSRQVVTSVKDKNPIKARLTHNAHLDDQQWHADLFEARMRSLTTSAALRLKKRLDAGMDSFEALIEVQSHLLSLAESFVEWELRNSFEEAVAHHQEQEGGGALQRLLLIWTLWRMEVRAAWFLENGFFETGKLKAIRNRIHALAKEIRPDDISLVDAFAIPAEALAAPIAFGDPSRW